MLLTNLVETLVTYLNSNTEVWAEELSIAAKAELDPSAIVLSDLGVYLVPNFVAYNLEGIKPRGQAIGTNDTLYVDLIVSRVFSELPSGDGVANWNEAKVLMNIRERCERRLIAWDGVGLTIVSIDPNPLVQLELDHRNFVAITTFGYEQTSCKSEHESNYSSGLLSVGTRSQLREASIQSVLSSVRRRGN